MKFILSILVAAAIIFGLFFAFSSPAVETQSTTAAEKPTTFQTITSDIESGAKLIDVRTTEEYAEGYIQGAELLPLADIQSGSYPQVDKMTKIYVYCRSGNRSAQATSLLRTAGYTNVVDLGGYDDVVSLGGKIVK
ncbi:rhodanese-like domain-containing protein [Candidatus Saccharibacteria bacterium]|nr:rhodanese-like domain-containing protein [Candidatus Saccharibacteria bacterium]